MSFRLQIPGVLPGAAAIAKIAAETDTILLSFSCGKDAIAAWLELRPHFKRIVPFYLYSIPGLEFVEKSLRYYEAFFEAKILRIPHPSLYRMLRNLVYQPPERCAIIEAAGIRPFGYDDVRQWLCEDLDLSQDTWYASGVRAADSLNRRASLIQHGPFTASKRAFYPIWDLNKAGMVDVLRRAKIKLPVDYQLFGRSFDGLYYRYLGPIRRHFPRDYARILEFFPLAELEFFRAGEAEVSRG